MDDIGFVPLVKRWWWLLALGALVAGAMAYVVTSRAAPTYKAEARLLVGPVNTDFATLRASGGLGRTYAELVTSRPVLESAIKATRVKLTTTDLRESVTASSNEITRLVIIGVEHQDAKASARLADALAERIRTLAAKSPAEDTAALDEFKRQEEVAGLALADRDRVLVAAQRVLSQSAAGRVTVIDPAEVPAEPIAPMVKLITLFAALAGLIIAGVVALVRESLSAGFADERVLADLRNPAFLGAIDAPRGKGGSLAVENGPHTPAAERYRGVATKVGFLDDRPPLRSLLVLDSNDGASSGVVAANLAAVLAEAERRVLLLDANTSKRGATSLLGLEHQPGYGELLESSRSAALNGQVDALRVTRSDGFDVVPSGSAAAAGLLDVERAQRVLQRLHQDADLVIVSAPPIHKSPAALVWARVAEGTMLVVDGGRISEEQLTEALRSLSFVEANVVGTVLGRTPGVFASR